MNRIIPVVVFLSLAIQTPWLCAIPFSQGRCPRQVLHLKDQQGTFQSPLYPRDYFPKQTCVWHIRVAPGYKVHLYFASPFDVQDSPSCGTDYVLVSTRIQRFSSPSAVQTGKHSIVFCGSRKPSNVTSAGRELWIRFQAKLGQAKGFKAFYEAQDIDECGKVNGGCQHQCVNIPGSYECKCPTGFSLQKYGKSCQKVQELSFTKKRYRAIVPVLATVRRYVVTVQATGGRSDVQCFYSILSIDGRVPGVRSLFVIARESGTISIRRKLTKTGRHRLLVEARSLGGLRAQTTVLIRVLAGKDLRFASPLYSVIIPDIIPRGRVILHLKVIKSGILVNATVTYSLSTSTPYFGLNSRTGALKITKSPSGLLTGKTAKSFALHVIAVSRGKVKQQTSTQVAIVVVPEYAGNPFVHSALEAINNQSNKERDNKRRRDGPERVATEFSLHRMFRRPSAEAQRISKADIKFDKVVREIKREVVKSVIDDPRARTGVVSVRLGPDSLASTSILSDLIKELNCSQPRANCTDNEYHAKYRTFDGTCNNLQNPVWGAASTAYTRMLDPVYFDENGLSEPIGFPDQPFAPEMPSAHLVSREFFIHRPKATQNEKQFSHMLMQWGQFMDHDISFTAESDGAETCFLPNCDGSPEDYEPPCFPLRYPDNDQCTMFTRSAAACQSDDENVTPREQLNTITSYIDGSQIYGSSKLEANNLRDFVTNKGYLRTSTRDLLPFIKSALKPPLNFCQVFGGCFDAGDFRVNEQIALASMHTLWVREHNRIVHELYHANKHWNPEKVFQEARKIVGAKLQHITYTEYLPKVLGKYAIPAYQGYRNTNPSVMNGFAGSAFRFGHSSVRPTFDLLDENFNPIAPEVPLMKAFFNNKLVQENGIEPILLGLLANVSQKTDREIADGLTKHLFQQPESEHGFDLAALNIQRGRDHGLPGYGVWRRECNLSHAEIFEETSFEIKDPKARRILRDLYDDVVEVADLFAAGLAEERVPGASVGPTFHCIIREQFLRLREGDRFWYENAAIFTPAQINEIKKVTLSQVLCDNINGIVSVQEDAFVAAMDSTKRKECSQIPRMDLSHWKEYQPFPGTGGNTEWSAWVNTVRTPTGSWAVAMGQQVCFSSIVNIECQLADGSPLATAHQVVHCKPLIGIYCRNQEQRIPKEKCKDYRFRFLCSSIPKPVPTEMSLSRHFSTPSNPYSQCDVARHPSDFPITFEATQHVTIHQPYEIQSTDNGFMFAGKNIGEPRKRFLLKFNTRKITRRAIIHSAFLHLYLLDFGGSVSIGSGEDRIAPNELEAYQVISTDWHPENTTSVVPWNENYLGIGTDVSQHRLSVSDEIKPEDQRRWISVDIQHALRNWQIRNQPNFGIMLKSRKEASSSALMRFASSSHETVELRPKLIVCLTIPPW